MVSDYLLFHLFPNFDPYNGAVKRVPGGVICIGGLASEVVLFF